jgi:hypothetical protein
MACRDCEHPDPEQPSVGYYNGHAHGLTELGPEEDWPAGAQAIIDQAGRRRAPLGEHTTADDPPAGGCNVSLKQQLSITKCTPGPWGKFGCYANDSRWMWAGGGCRGVFVCNGHSNVSCGDGFGRKLACPCVLGPLPPPPPFPPPPPPPPIPPAPPALPGPMCNINGCVQSAWICRAPTALLTLPLRRLL